MTATIHHGDCIEVLRTLPDASVDAVVTDPPYGLGFMGKEWDKGRMLGQMATGNETRGAYAYGGSHDRGYADHDADGFQVWCHQWATECLRVLKPGGHLLAFGGTRTWHRLAVAIEDAGFEVRDSIAWLYGSGFPKSLDVSKAIDKARDDRADILRVTSEIARLRDLAGLTNRDLDDAFGFAGMAGHWTSTKSQPTVPTVDQWAVLRDMLNPDEWLDAEVWRLNGRKGTPGEAWQSAEVIDTDERWNEPSGIVNAGQGSREFVTREIKAPATPAAQQWQGWGTALKPAFEPVVVARKPLIGTVAANVLEHGTGALNIDGCRIGYSSDADMQSAQALADLRARGRRLGFLGEPGQGQSLAVAKSGDTRDGTEPAAQNPAGRWPANVILDEDQAEVLDGQSGVSASSKPSPAANYGARVYAANNEVYGRGLATTTPNVPPYGDTGGASRFFYCPKAPKRERPKVDGIAHPTVKPLALMRYLCRLVTPPGGVILEPFAGSGTTVEAALLEGFNIIAIEREAEYLPLIQARLDRIKEETDGQLDFGTPA